MSNHITFVVRRSLRNLGWDVRASHEAMGDMPVGPRLAKGVRYPNEIGTTFENKGDAERAAVSWADWYNNQPYLSKKRKTKYLA